MRHSTVTNISGLGILLLGSLMFGAACGDAPVEGAPDDQARLGHVEQATGSCSPLTRPPPACNNYVCEGDTWTLSPIAGGATCLINGAAGKCGFGDDLGTCLPPISGSVTSKYYVVAVEYAPPGAGSNVDYGAGTTWQTTTTSKSSFQDSVEVSVTNGAGLFGFASGGITLTGGRSSTTTSTDVIDVKGTTQTDFIINGHVELVDHGLDRIYLWLNPVMAMTIYGDGNITDWSLSPSSNQNNLIYVTPNWLVNSATMPPGVRSALEGAGITPDDYLQILSVDPYATAFPELDTNRYAFLQELPYEPPAASGVGQTTEKFTINAANTQTSSEESKVEYSAGITIQGGVDFIAKLKLKVSGKLTWTSDNTDSTSNGSTYSAVANIQQPPFGYAGPAFLDVYLDTIYNTLLFVIPGAATVTPACTPDSPATTCAGKQCGTAVNNCGQTVTCQNTCVLPQACGVGGAGPNSCGCVAEPLATTCAGKQCGGAVNNCGQSVTCPNTCTGAQTCGGAGAGPNSCGCASTGNPCGTRCGGTATDNCGNVYTCHQDCGLQGMCPSRGGTCSAASHQCVCRSGPGL